MATARGKAKAAGKARAAKKKSTKRASGKGGKLRVHITHSAETVPSQRVSVEQLRDAVKRVSGLNARLEIAVGDGKEALDAGLQEADILFTAGFIDLNDLRARAPRLKWVQSMSAGVEKFVPMIPDDIVLTNASGVHGPRGGEYGMTAILMLNSKVPQFVSNAKVASWEQLQTTPVAGKTVTLLGVGAIGSVTAKLAKQFGMKVLGVTRNGRPHRYVDKMYKPKDLAKVLPQSDFVVSTLPLTAETRGMLGKAELDLLPRHAGIASLGRARVIDYDALLEKLIKRELGGAVLDVFYQEPMAPSEPLWTAPNVILSPHCAVDDESVYVPRCLDIFVDNLNRFSRGKPLNNVVDPKLGY
jgi:phosphoglycerate dehydrogenase-like enzyme